MSQNRVIGNGNKLPAWDAPGDLKRFQALTKGKVVIMGRCTFESIGKPLSRRINLVVSKTMQPSVGVRVYPSLDAAIHEAAIIGRKFNFGDEIMIIGGAQIYEQSLPLATRIYLTLVQGEHEGDRFFPEISEKEWELETCEELLTHSYLTYRRKF